MPTRWKGEATVEVYISSDVRISVGDLVGAALYDELWRDLRDLCPTHIGHVKTKVCRNAAQSFETKYLQENGKVDTSQSPV
jgi:hypothetical protein